MPSTWTFEDEVTRYTMFPHVHFWGKSTRFTGYYPDGSQEALISVANSDFNWQGFYEMHLVYFGFVRDAAANAP